MRKQILLFDLDGTMFDSKKFVSIVSQLCHSQLGLTYETYMASREAYYATLKKSTDFDPKEFSHLLAESTKVAFDAIYHLFWDERKAYEQSVYPDVMPVLTLLQNNFTLGIFSEGMIYFQQHKLQFSGLEQFFDPNYICIFRRKLEQQALSSVPKEALIIDDKEEVVQELLKNDYMPIWINRRDERVLDHVHTIHNLDHLVTAL